MRVSFRHRIFISLIALGAIPLAVAVTALTLQTRTSTSLAGPRIALDNIAESSRDLSSVFDTLNLSQTERAALQRHAEIVARGTRRTRQAETLSRAAAAILATVILISGIGLVGGSVYLARRWSRTVSAPVENLIELIQRIEKREPLPEPADRPGIPEVEALTVALHKMANELAHARIRELEQERLIAFREVARRVAHEIRGPVTASRLAVAQLDRNPPHARADAMSVLEEETERLEQMAVEFSLFGRLPEGPRAEIDVDEMVRSLITATVPPNLPVRIHMPKGIKLTGQYEPLRRAVQNLISNAVAVTDERGLDIHVSRSTPPATVHISIADFGPGVPDDQKEKIFEPYVTTKRQGTGLGLAIVRQVVEAHGGVARVDQTPGGGATFVIDLPVESE